MNIPLKDYWIIALRTIFSTSYSPYNIPHKTLKYNNKTAKIDRSYISYKENVVIFFVKDQFVNLEIIIRWTPNKPLKLIEAPFTVDVLAMLPLSLETQVLTALAYEQLSYIRIFLLQKVLKFGNKIVTLD